MSAANQRRVINITGAAVVCFHVAKNGCPILLAQRDEPVDPDDSGWQFLCNSGAQEDERLAQVWAVSEVIERDATLKNIVREPPGSKFRREDDKSPWISIK